MKPNTRFFLILPVLFLIPNIILPIYYESKLPSTVAIHYDINGDADRYGNKTTLFYIHLAVAIVSILIFYSTIACVSKCPASSLNVPNREYWATSEMRPVLVEKTIPFISIIYSFIEVLDFCIFLIVYRSNVIDAKKLEGFWSIYIIISVFFVLIIIFSIRFKKSFKKIDSQPLSQRDDW
ncbi:membrane protein-related [Anaeramoeba flamelloides]|uniref:Membrane protein-related n=1 Tax=Anaeramoeba flamelloides TaxID=1746091 RepID=A0ABQ8XT39_9EUKA|nr:membrane protein-related [Anaeramoeba flamelloides]